MAATPQSTTSYQEDADDKKLEQITFRFCSECSNMLYPKEDEEAHKLQFTCRTCQYTEEARSTCVFRNILNNSAGETAGVTQDVGSDPTVSEALASCCIACGVVITCNSCGSPCPDMTVATRQHKYPSDKGRGDRDAMMAMATNVGWTLEDVLDEFGDEAVIDFTKGFFATDESEYTYTTTDSKSDTTSH